ncbi:thioredoxin domain-containing protein [Simkania sp.]|uniref:thioredoxin domain-containing protein n=1 Tax=Simkania sp. TaxID=34094 RepID=UPI003B51E6DB
MVFENRLIKEKSPYLLQHAHNPVDWYPWGEEAFEAAKKLDKPIFLSIGYTTCHWCHVMSRESFENSEIATLMNETFINVKVDREELPEIDSLYMEFAQALMASGSGWPLNLILTADLKPFYATTYMPPTTRQEMMGVKELTSHIKQLWKSGERELLLDQAEKLVDLFARSVQTRGEELPSEGHLDTAMALLYEAIDPVYGGMKGAPKFPLEYQVPFFLEHARREQDSRSLFFAELTLSMMHRGGIFDQVGGGFSRYSVDEKWIIPHFEKMLYDNALMALAFLDAWKLTKKPLYRQVCEEILDYLLRDMQHQGGGFYSAEDAETDGEEGAYYTWHAQEIQQLLSPDDLDLFCEYFDVTPKGNFGGKNVLHRTMSIEEFSELRGLDPLVIQTRLDTCLSLLFEARNDRKRPFKDDKILVTWNAMAIDAFIKAGRAFQNETYLKSGLAAANFIRQNLWKDGRLKRHFREGQTDYEGGLDDYAYLIRALVTLAEADLGNVWLDWALEMSDFLEKEFKAEEGAFYQTGPDHSILLRRPELFDGAQPSGNAIHAENLIRLSQLSQNRELRIQAEDILKVATSYIETYPQGACYHLIALQHYLDKEALTIVVALDEKENLKEEILEVLSSEFIPHHVVFWKRHSDQRFEENVPTEGKTTIYLCKQGKCEAPITSIDALRHRFT